MHANYSNWAQRKTLLLVDDEPNNLHLLRQILQYDYHLLYATDGKKALEICKTQKPDLILLDIMLPKINGYKVCEALKQNPNTERVPIIFISAMGKTTDQTHGFELGAVDYITKPISPGIIKARISTHLSLVRNKELQESRLQIIHRLSRAAEYKDNETGLHVIRISHYSHILALAAGLSKPVAEIIYQAAPMHDIGKIGIPDHILLKPGPLNEEEWAVMRQHPEIGAQIIGEHDSDLLRSAALISLSHHEKWDGSGYPNGLKGKDIPLEGRIVSIVDVFDALTSKRPYKKAWPIKRAVAYLQNQAGHHFDPELTALFIDHLPHILEIKKRWSEQGLSDNQLAIPN
jgi:putative two-component system response regulator